MKKLVMILPLVILLCFTFSCQKAEEVAEEPGVKPLSDADVAAIKAIGPAIDKATLEWDIDALLELWTEDTLLMNQNAPIIQGRAGVAEYYKPFETVTWKEHKHELLEVDGYGDIAYARGAYKVAYVLEGAAEPTKLEGKTLLIFRKQPNGSWLISRFCWNSDLPLPE
jgi:ketosteroid isomerase-like protein